MEQLRAGIWVDSNETFPDEAFSLTAEAAEQRTKVAAMAAITIRMVFFITVFVCCLITNAAF
jgi:hypothetical protein